MLFRSNKLYNYLKSCYGCQIRKPQTDIERPFELRIPANFIPFRVMYADLKVMYPSSAGNVYLLVNTCKITRYCIAVPLRNREAPTIAEAFLRKVILSVGAPKLIIMDADTSFLNKVSTFLWNAVKTTVKCISPYNHKSHLVERSIGSIANLIHANLKGTGRNCDVFIDSVLYAYNSHIIPRLGFSPYYLVYMRKPQSLGDLQYTPLDDIDRKSVV